MARARISGWTGALVVGGTLIALLWLERRFPLRRAKPEPDRRRVSRNFMMAAATAGVVRLCEQPLVAPLTKWVDRRQAGLLPFLKLQPMAEMLLGVVLLDYSLYWWHILLHRVPFLWRSHLVHHTDLVLDTSTALRFHWLEFLASIPWRLAQVSILGIRPRTLMVWQRLTAVEVLFHHSNVRLPVEMERRLSRFIVTPRLHGIHHSVISEERNTNFSSGLSIWDVLHGTLKTDVPQGDIEIGVREYRAPQQLGLARLLALPFRMQRSNRGLRRLTVRSFDKPGWRHQTQRHEPAGLRE